MSMVNHRWKVLTLLALLQASMVRAAEPPAEALLYETGFEEGATEWEPTDSQAWRVEETDNGKVYSQFKKQSAYEPPHRSPLNISLLKDIVVGDFTLTARVLSTHEDYGHRDACLVFGYQDPAHFYYVHLGKQTDDHANQIFIVNDAPRTKISEKTSDGTDWTENWHQVRIVRRTHDGLVEVYFDDMDTPVMVAHDKTFLTGRIGVGTFDDTSQWDDIRLYAERTEPKPGP